MAETLPRIQPDKPQVFRGVEVSFGIAPILSTLSDLSMRHNRPAWTLYLINVETLIRDRKEEKTDNEKIARAVLLDCTVMAQYISAYCRLSLAPQMKQNPIVCFYLPHYEDLPKAYVRDKFPKGTEARWGVRDTIERIITSEGYQDHYDDTQVFFTVVGKGGKWPHKDLIRDLAKLKEGIQYRKVLMVSHVPLDFHLYRVFSDFSILESYTGAIKQQKQFGKKVFGDEVFPFNKYTHLLFGDKWYLKPLVKSSVRKMMKEKAAREHWSIIPDKGVLTSLVQMNAVHSDLYVKPDI